METPDKRRTRKLIALKRAYYSDLINKRGVALKKLAEAKLEYTEVLSALTEYKKLTLEDFEADLQVEDVLPGDENTPS